MRVLVQEQEKDKHVIRVKPVYLKGFHPNLAGASGCHFLNMRGLESGGCDFKFNDKLWSVRVLTVALAYRPASVPSSRGSKQWFLPDRQSVACLS